MYIGPSLKASRWPPYFNAQISRNWLDGFPYASSVRTVRVINYIKVVALVTMPSKSPCHYAQTG
jgi:hypothetical protein